MDIVTRMEPFQHIDIHRVAITFSQARKRVPYGLFATTTPMRFENGTLTQRCRGRKYTFQRLFDEQGQEMLYIISFYLPRFMDLDFREKLITVFHELWHISPQFNGDLRRHTGRCYVHSHSQKDYDAQMSRFVDQWLPLASAEDYHFLQCNFDQLHKRYGSVHGVKIPHPKLIPID